MNKEQQNPKSPIRTIRSSVAVALMAAGIIGCTALNPGAEYPTTVPTPTPISREILPKTNQQIIEQEVKRLGIELSSKEAQMWQTQGYDKLPYKRSVNQETVAQATERLPIVLELMQKSENPYLSQSGEFLVNLSAAGQVIFSLETEPIKASHAKTTALATTPVIENKKLSYLIMIDAEEMINNSNSTLLALQLTHEAEHVKNSVNIISLLPPSFTPEQILKKELERSQDINEFVEEESRAWTWESWAYIYQYGLGFHGIVQTNIHQHAAAFIRNSNGNPETPEWQKYVAKEILGIQNWQPEEN